MKTIVLVRHSNAEDGGAGIPDFDRKLNEEGILKAKKIAGKCSSIFRSIDTVFLSSTAPRAFQTAEIFAEELGYSLTDIRPLEFLYNEFAPDDLISELRYYNRFDTVWIFGHNPMMADLCEFFTGYETNSFPKCMVKAIDFNIESFKNIRERSGRVVYVINPKKL